MSRAEARNRLGQSDAGQHLDRVISRARLFVAYQGLVWAAVLSAVLIESMGLSFAIIVVPISGFFSAVGVYLHYQKIDGSSRTSYRHLRQLRYLAVTSFVLIFLATLRVVGGQWTPIDLDSLSAHGAPLIALGVATALSAVPLPLALNGRVLARFGVRREFLRRRHPEIERVFD